MKELLQHKYTKRILLISVISSLILILITRFYILPNYEAVKPENVPLSYVVKDPAWLNIVSRLLDSLFVSLLVTLCVSLYLSYIELPKDEKKFEIIESFALPQMFSLERESAKFWYFSGGTGSYTRATTIPILSDMAKRGNKHINIKIQIIDPTDFELCQKYALYRNSLRSAASNSSRWTTNYVQQQVLATIILSTIYKSNNNLIEIDIRLKNSFSTMRIDLSSTSAIITKEDPKEPALICRQDSFLYRTYIEEFNQTFKQNKSLVLPDNFSYNLSKLSLDQVINIINSLSLGNHFTQDDYNRIHEVLKKNTSLYG